MIGWILGKKSASKSEKKSEKQIDQTLGGSGANQKSTHQVEIRSEKLIFLLNNLGIDVSPHIHSTHLVVFGAVSIVKRLLEDNDIDVSKLTREQRTVLGVFLFVVSNVLSQMQHAPMELVTLMACLQILGLSSLEAEMSDVTALYNDSTNRDDTKLMGDNLVLWIRKPLPSNFNRLGNLLSAYLDHAKTV